MQKKHFSFLLIAIIVAATIDSCSKSSPSVPAGGSTPPTLIAAVSATVDNNFNITYTDDPIWDAAVTSVQVGGNTLSGTAWSITAGVLTLKPSQSSFLQTARSFTVTVLATGYNNDIVTQTIGAGAATKLGITTQPSAPATNGGALVTHPVVSIKDQYGNVVGSSASITAAVGSGAWTLGGTTTVSAISGAATFSNLTATSAGPVTGAIITFTSGSLTSVTSSSFNIPAPLGPTLTAAVGTTVDNNFNVAYTDNPTWDAAVTSVQIGGNTLPGTAWSISGGILTLKPSQSLFLQTAGTFTVTVLAAGYSNDAVTQTISAGAATKLAIATQPTAPATNGRALGTHPLVSIKDQYNNIVASSAGITAAVGSGTWTLGGTTTVSAISGVATFSNLTAASAAAVTGATIVFSSGSLTGATSSPFNIPAIDTAAKYNTDVVPILSANCYSCHNSGGIQQDGVILNTYNGVKAAISSGAFPDVLTGANGFPQMPDGAAPLSTTEINKIKSWVNDGAINN